MATTVGSVAGFLLAFLIIPPGCQDQVNQINLCEPLPTARPRLYLGFMSGNTARNRERRKFIRESWLPALLQIWGAGFNISYHFYVCDLPEDTVEGALLHAESNLHRDMMLMDYPEKYSDLYRKTQAMMAYATDVAGADFFAKSDDDIVMDVAKVYPRITAVLHENVIAGRIQTNNPADKTLPAMANYRVMPPYPWGGFYVMGKNIFHFLHINRTDTPKYHVDDVGLGLALDYGVEKRMISPMFAKSFLLTKNLCLPGALVLHIKELHQMQCIWNHFLEQRDPCCQ